MKELNVLKEYRYLIISMLVGVILIGIMWIIALSGKSPEKQYDGFKVEVTSVNSAIIGGAVEKEKPIFSDTTIEFNVDLNNIGDQIIYQINVKNKGSVNALLETIKRNFIDGGDIVYEFNEAREGSIVNAGDNQLVVLSITRIGGTSGVLNTNFKVSLNYAETSLSSDAAKTLMPSVSATSVPGQNKSGSVVNEITVKGLANVKIDYISGSDEDTSNTDLPRYRSLGFTIYDNASEELIGKVDNDKITIYQDTNNNNHGYYIVGLSGVNSEGKINSFEVTLYVVDAEDNYSFSYSCNNVSMASQTYCGFNNYILPLDANACDETIFSCK